jgi:hypothetical protein
MSIELAFLSLLRSCAPMAALGHWTLPLWSAVVAMVAPTPPPPPPLGPMEHLCLWMRALPLWSAVADVVADTRIPRPLLICFVVVVFIVIVGLMLLLLSRSDPLPRRSRRAPKRWYGSDAAVLAAKRGEKPPSGARLGGGSGGGGGGTSGTITSGADEPPAASDPPRAAAPAISISEPIPTLLAAFSIVYTIASMLLKRAPTVKLFFVCGLLASVAVAVEAKDRIHYSPRRKADGTAQEHAIDVARPSDHQMEEKYTQKKGEETTVGEHMRWKPRSLCIEYYTYMTGAY